MKPAELLRLIEGAAGTSMYQHKREQALNHIRKKDLKLEEINNILKMEVTPKLEQLNRDKNALDEFKAKQSRLERTERTLVAFRFHDLTKQAQEGRDAALKEQEAQLAAKIEGHQRKLMDAQKMIAALEQQHQQDGAQVKELQSQISLQETALFKTQQGLKAI